MNDLLTPLAIVGIVVFAIVLVLLAILLVRQALGLVRLVRSARITIRVVSSEPAELPDLEPLEPPADRRHRDDVRKGWGFD